MDVDERATTRSTDSARKCAQMMKMARNDTDRVAVLALIPKLMTQKSKKANKNDESDMVTIADSIPIDFLERLFDSADDDGHVLAIRVLARLLMADDVASAGNFKELISRVLDLLKRQLKDDIMEDVLFCCTRMDKEIAFSTEFWQSMTESIKINRAGPVIDATFNVYNDSLTKEGDATDLQRNMNGFLDELFKRIRVDETPLHFEMLTNFCDSLSSINTSDIPHTVEFQTSTWLRDLRTILRNILQSRRTGDRERQLAITLASTMSSLFDYSWLRNDAELLQLLTSMAAIDVRLILDKETEFSGMDSLYVAKCCRFLEFALKCAAESGEKDDAVVNERQALQINNTLLDLTDFLLEFFVVLEERKIDFPKYVSYALYRFVCAYLAEGLVLVRRDNLMAAAKPLLDLNRKATQFDESDVEESDRFESMALFLPALSELVETEGTEWNSVKRAFRNNGVVELMETYFRKHDAISEEYREIFDRWKAL